MSELIAFLGGAIFLFLLQNAGIPFLSGYGSRKGQNTADKEDVANLTKLVEEVKSEFASILEDKKTSNQLRLAALNERLKAHQEAFALWRKLYGATHKENITQIVMECQDWWDKNCLYLEPDAREAFSRAYWCAGMHKQLLNPAVRDSDSAKLVTDNWNRITAAGEIIVKCAALPGLTSEEKKKVEEESLVLAKG